jgi:uncharacterized protein (DUF2164 family)
VEEARQYSAVKRQEMQIELSNERKREVLSQLQSVFEREFDEPLSDFRANAILELFMKSLCPAVYNQAVQDVRAHLQRKLDDLDGEIYIDAEF